MTGLHAGLRALILVAGLLPLLAQAYSGAGGECGNSALEAAALRGTPLELEQALDKGVQDIEKVVDSAHEAGVIVHRTQKTAAWADIVQAMVEKGAEASSAEQAAIIAYLQKALPPKGDLAP